MMTDTDLIAAIPMIQAISYPTQGHVIHTLTEISKAEMVPPGTILCQEGNDTDHTGIIILTGSVAVYANGASTFKVRAPELMGEMHQLSETSEHRASVRTLETSKILRFKWHDFVRHVQDNALIDQRHEKEIRDVIRDFAEKRLQRLDASRA